MTLFYKDRFFMQHMIYTYIYDLLEKTDWSISKKISYLPTHPLYNLLARVKDSSKHLRTHTSLLPCVNTERFKTSFINRLFKIYFYFLTNNIRHLNICMFLYLHIQQRLKTVHVQCIPDKINGLSD